MRNDLTDITIVMDRSGSMLTCQKDSEGGINALIEEQKKEPGEVLFTLVQFDSKYEVVHNGVPLKDVPPVKLVPRGLTALLDAVGCAIKTTGERLAAMSEDERPAAVIFVIVTDGGENASLEYNREQVKQMIEHQQTAYNWKIIFIGANQDAFATAGGLGVYVNNTANYNTNATAGTYNAVSSSVTRTRSMSMNFGGVCDPLAQSFTAEERSAMVGEQK